MRKQVLVPLAPGFEEVEAVAVIDLLRRAGIEVTVAGLGPAPISGRSQIAIVPDTPLDSVADATFDMIVLPGGGPGTEALRRDGRIASLLKRHAEAGRWIAAICAAPTVLQDVGLLAGRQATSYPSAQPQLTSADYRTERVVIDGNIITSRAPGTAIEFALMLIERLVGADVRRQVATDILAHGAVDGTPD